MSEQMGISGYPSLTRHPELQRIREAQNQLLIDPNFMNSLFGMGQQIGQGFTNQGGAQGGGMGGPPQQRKDQSHLQFQGDMRQYRQQYAKQRMGNPGGGGPLMGQQGGFATSGQQPGGK